MNSHVFCKKNKTTTQKNYHLSLIDELKVLEIRQKNPKATGAVGEVFQTRL
jgi:hypothetical protein